MATSADSLVREGIAAFKGGSRDKARDLLMKAVELDQYSEQGWLWLSAVVDSVEDQRTCLENALAINPDNDRARNGLQSLIDQQLPSFGSPPPSRPADEAWPTPGSKATGTSVEWGGGLETSSPSAYRAIPEPSKDDYDDWLSNLNLPAASPSSPAVPVTAAFTAPFDTDDEDFGLNGPFSAPSVDDILDQLPPVAAPSRPDDSIRSAFRSSAARAAEPEPAPRPPAPPAPKAAPVREPPKPAREPARQPALSAAVDLDDPFVDLEGDIDLNSTGLFTSLDEVDDGSLEEMNADELFDYIPEDIKPTRLPGTIERYPAALIVMLVLLVLLNVGAVALLVYRMT